MEDHLGAIEDYSTTIVLEPGYDDAYNNRGYSKLSLGFF